MKHIATYDFTNPDFAGWLQNNMAADEIHFVGNVTCSQLKSLDAAFAALKGKIVDISELSVIQPDWEIEKECDFWDIFYEDLMYESDLSQNYFEKLYLNNDYSTRFAIYEDYALSEDGKCLAAFIDSSSAIIPDGITYIGHGAFASLHKLRSVDFPNTVTKIGQAAFAEIEYLKAVVLPSSLRELSERAFYACNELQSVVLPEGLTEIPIECFRYCEIEEINFPSSLKAIRADAFHAGLLMDYLILPEGLEILESGAFATGLLMVHLPSTLKQCDEDWYYDILIGKVCDCPTIC